MYGAESGLGDQEAFAYVGCWLRAAGRPWGTRDFPGTHAKWKPPVADVVAYAQEMGMV